MKLLVDHVICISEVSYRAKRFLLYWSLEAPKMKTLSTSMTMTTRTSQQSVAYSRSVPEPTSRESLLLLAAGS